MGERFLQMGSKLLSHLPARALLELKYPFHKDDVVRLYNPARGSLLLKIAQGTKVVLLWNAS